MTWENNNIILLKNSKLQSTLYSMIPILENNFLYVHRKKTRRMSQWDGIRDLYVCVLFYICQVGYNKHTIFLIIKYTNMLFKN